MTDRLLRDYPTDVDAGDLFRHASGPMVEKWRMMARGLEALAEDASIPVQELVSRQIQDLGMSFRMAGDPEEREWPLNPVPLLIGAEEWSVVEQGLIQRARLLEGVVADIYGAQSLVKGGQLPAAMVTGSPFFARNMVGLKPGGNTYLHVYAADLARGPYGQWRIIGDRLRLANGIGYALENRITLSRSTGTLLADLNTRRLAHFFSELREGIARECGRENPRIAFLTPGRFNQSYPEQAHLARYLGFPLVEGRDLTVDEDRLYVRTIAGPKRVDAVWRWIDTNALDPLSFDSRSAIGVPDLFDAFARGGLEIANWPGVELLEAPAFAAFLPRLCRTLLGEEPILPNIATWWCGQQGEADVVRARLDELVIRSAFGAAVEGVNRGPARPGRDLSDEERATLLEAMDRRPMDYCAQEVVRLSTTPALIGEHFQPRAFTVRAFVARGSDGQWTVMPGGFARLSSSGEISTTLMGEGDISADVCVVDGPGIVQVGQTVLGGIPEIRRGGGILASQPADNLFWFGRYCERAEMTVRIIRSILGSSIDVDAASGRAPEVRALLISLLGEWGAIMPGNFEPGAARVCRAALAESTLPGGVLSLLNRIRDTGLSLRDRFALDFWRIASRPMPYLDSARPGALMRVARELIERFSALSGLMAEDMVRGPVRHFLELGRRMERAIGTCRVVRHLAQASDEADALNVLLDLCDSQITYRTRYLSGALRDPVYDLVLLDPDNPRSLLFQIDAINRHLEAQVRLTDSSLPEQPLREAQATLAPFLGLSVMDLDIGLIKKTEARLLSLSDAISARFFLQYERPQSVIRSSTIE